MFEDARDQKRQKRGASVKIWHLWNVKHFVIDSTNLFRAKGFQIVALKVSGRPPKSQKPFKGYKSL